MSVSPPPRPRRTGRRRRGGVCAILLQYADRALRRRRRTDSVPGGRRSRGRSLRGSGDGHVAAGTRGRVSRCPATSVREESGTVTRQAGVLGPRVGALRLVTLREI